jgi:hypothetical protein
MMEDNTCACNGKGGGMMCGGGYSHRMMGCGGHWIAKQVAMILVLVAVFCLGTKLGELRALMHYERGGYYGMMENGYNSNNMMIPQ